MLDLASFINSATTSELKLILAGAEKRLAEQGDLTPIRVGGSASVPEGTKHLTPDELHMATDAFAAWCAEAKTPIQSRSRNRLWIAFILIRYGGLRLGEVLAIDDRIDFNTSRSEVTIRGSHGRTVLLPEPVIGVIAELLSSPMFCGLRGQILTLDQGYLRRKFYQRAKACGVPGSLFNPRVLRQSRAIELLRGGMPLQVVQAFLGQSNTVTGTSYLEFSGALTQRIVQQYVNREVKMKTSARNAFTGTVSRLVQDGILVEVELTTMSGLKVVAVITVESLNNLRISEGSTVTATIKAPWVVLCEEGEVQTSARNKFSGTITAIKSSDIACEVTVELADRNKVCALVTRESVDGLDLKVGKTILAMFKAFSVIINVE